MFEKNLSILSKSVSSVVPYFQSENFLLYNEDCLTTLKQIPKSAVDLTITSPPYNIGKSYECVKPLHDYLDWCGKWLKEVYRVSADDGALLLNLGYIAVEGKGKCVPLPYLLFPSISFFLMQEIVWNYGAGVAAKKFLSPRNEKLLWCVKNPEFYTFNLDDIRDPDVKYPMQKKNGKLRCNTIGKNPSDVWQIAKVTSGAGRSSEERTVHPAQFPLDLIDRCVKGFSNAGDVILDPFAGSGTVAESALRLNRKVLCFEVRKDYCDLIIERVKRL